MDIVTSDTVPPTPPEILAPPEVAALERLGDEIAELSAHLDAASARLLDLLRDFDARGGWNTGFRSCAHWLAWRTGLDLGAARERVRVARALGRLPRLAQALAGGELSYAKVRALTRVATPETEERLLALGRVATAAQVERIVRGWRQVDRQAEAAETARRHRARALYVHQDDDGMVVIRGRLEPEVGALVVRALEAAGDHLYRTLWRPRQRKRFPLDPPSDGAAPPPNASAEATPADGPTPAAESPLGAAVAPDAPEPDALPSDFAPIPSTAQLRADALALIAESALHHGLDPGGAGARYQVVVHVDAAVLADPEQPGQSVLEDGVRVSAETAQRLACDASRVVMRHDPDGRVVEVGARTRTVPPALRRALQHRDGGCRFPGCTSRFTQAHHIRHWAQGGPTTLANLVSLCGFHHAAVHERGFRVERRADGTLGFRWPHGRPLPEVPPPMPMPEDPAATLRERHEALGLRIHPRTGCSTWAGERLDVGYVIDVLHPLAVGGPAPAALSTPR